MLSISLKNVACKYVCLHSYTIHDIVYYNYVWPAEIEKDGERFSFQPCSTQIKCGCYLGVECRQLHRLQTSIRASDIPSLLIIVASFGLTFATRDEKTGHFIASCLCLARELILLNPFHRDLIFFKCKFPGLIFNFLIYSIYLLYINFNFLS